MNLKEHFESIIGKIEKKAENPYEQKASNIAENICKEEFINIREFNAIFKFLTDYSIIEYIKERKMMIAYKMLIEAEEFDPQTAIEISGLDNQNSFGKKFKETFGMSPKDAYEKCDKKLCKEPLSWEQINSNEQQEFKATNRTEEMVFGIERSQYDKIMEASDYKSLYNFDNLQSEVAFKISEKDNISVKDAFMLVDDYLEYCRFTDKNEPNEKKLNFLLSPKAKQMKRLYFEATGSIFGAFDLIEEAKECEINLNKINTEYLEEYYKNPCYDLEELLEHIENFRKFGGKDFEEYMSWIHLGCSDKDAAKGISTQLEEYDFEEDNPCYDDSDTDVLE